MYLDPSSPLLPPGGMKALLYTRVSYSMYLFSSLNSFQIKMYFYQNNAHPTVLQMPQNTDQRKIFLQWLMVKWPTSNTFLSQFLTSLLNNVSQSKFLISRIPHTRRWGSRYLLPEERAANSTPESSPGAGTSPEANIHLLFLLLFLLFLHFTAASKFFLHQFTAHSLHSTIMLFTILDLVFIAHLTQVLTQRKLLLLTRSSRIKKQESLPVHRSTVKFRSPIRIAGLRSMWSWSSACFGITVLMLVWMNLLLWILSAIVLSTHTHTDPPWQSCSTDGALGLTTESPPTLMITAQCGSWASNKCIQDNFKCFAWCFFC